MPMLIEDKTVSGTGSFVASSFVYHYYISRLGLGLFRFYLFTLLPGTQRMLSAW